MRRYGGTIPTRVHMCLAQPTHARDPYMSQVAQDRSVCKFIMLSQQAFARHLLLVLAPFADVTFSSNPAAI